ncbi:MAG: ATP-binding protein [Atopobiaceae bacterium]
MGTDAESLAAFIAKTGHASSLRVEESYGDGFVRLRVDEAERRQAKHDIRSVEDAAIELLRNARDAGAHTILFALQKAEGLRTLTVVDDGTGIPEDMQERIFDARVTSKLDTMHMDAWGVHGRGMALFSIRQNAEMSRVVQSEPGCGTSIQVAFDTAKIPEKADQSAWPEYEQTEDGTISIVRGPHNLLRCACEFALEDRGACEVYVGSPAEAIAAARRHVRIPRDVRERILQTKLEDLPLLLRLRLAPDAEELAQIGASMGLDISERTAQRILSGEIAPAQGAYAYLRGKKAAVRHGQRKVDLEKDPRTVRISKEDLDKFRGMLVRDFQFLEERYYLELQAPPELHVSSGRLSCTFEFAEDD